MPRAQSRGSQRVTGKVLDDAGKPVVGAQVSAAKKGEVKPDVFTATTNDKGEYALNGLAAGDWVIEAEEGRRRCEGGPCLARRG